MKKPTLGSRFQGLIYSFRELKLRPRFRDFFKIKKKKNNENTRVGENISFLLISPSLDLFRLRTDFAPVGRYFCFQKKTDAPLNSFRPLNLKLFCWFFFVSSMN